MRTNQNLLANRDDLLSEKEAAEYLHQKPRTLRLWRIRRALPHFKPTTKVILYSRSDLDGWLLTHHRVGTVS
ncbi:MAG: helix-turn-helix domain-containing protein [Verrucomicrobiota bacterium]|nr:helix-turn-helix domain-containing protein [Verrucomicrobiota bacterium]